MVESERKEEKLILGYEKEKFKMERKYPNDMEEIEVERMTTMSKRRALCHGIIDNKIHFRKDHGACFAPS